MAQGETPITLVGNIVADPELRYTPSGKPVASARVASTPRAFNRDTNQWEDQDGLFLTCNIWGDAAENVMETLSKGMRVIVQGRLRQRNYENRNGERRSVYEVEVDDIGPSLKFATATVHRSGSRGGGNQGGGNWSGGDQGANQGGGNWGGDQGANWGGGATTGGGFPADDEAPF